MAIKRVERIASHEKGAVLSYVNIDAKKRNGPVKQAVTPRPKIISRLNLIEILVPF